ncbi:hypothetical protein GLAREA_12099 [Glarea lozoyensis ATCC 20868]|uniref:F-box domain-containing protein n=1 Tax=Glarea lozoyensis (strain ATCC 20868 / MF5171) TaxID=1116229 RepID=S3D0F6_GLAL2|nr:uncharacterized protein GLAREA_12099 [Glarea lozoyensis ATCC 20868]EPE32017.1 hypothetical protein GLAREA_12099 [Glarea lozoyensis ATCC 20868]
MANQEATSRLETLSTELLQQIVVLLPCQSALSFVLCSRRIRHACDQLRLWRQIVQSTSGDILFTGPTGRVKVAIADIKSHHIKYETELLQWLPQAIALYDRLYSCTSLLNLHFLSDLSYHSTGQPVFGNKLLTVWDQPQREYPTDIASPFNIDTWYEAQAASFCFTTTILYKNSYTENAIGSPWSHAQYLLETSPWTEIQATDPILQPAEYLKLTTILHTLANKVIGFLGARLWAYLIRHKPALTGVSGPPEPKKIPFSTLMDLPDFFEPNSVQKFSLCHVAKMAAPSFFEHSQWTGFECEMKQESEESITTYKWNGIGADTNNLTQQRHTEVNCYAKFQLSHCEDSRFYVLQSNCFVSGQETHNLTLRVDSRTGMIWVIDHSDINNVQKPGKFGVITPFGLIFGGSSPGYWLWLWKSEWSGWHPGSAAHEAVLNVNFFPNFNPFIANAVRNLAGLGGPAVQQQDPDTS